MTKRKKSGEGTDADPQVEPPPDDADPQVEPPPDDADPQVEPPAPDLEEALVSLSDRVRRLEEALVSLSDRVRRLEAELEASRARLTAIEPAVIRVRTRDGRARHWAGGLAFGRTARPIRTDTITPARLREILADPSLEALTD